MRLYTHTDLDGVMCAVLISCVEEVDEIRFVDPGTIQSGKIPFTKNDIISDLPFDRKCGLWFDHHESSRPKDGAKFEGAWAMAPSAARVAYDYFENPYLEKYLPAVLETDRIDSGKVRLDEVENPQGYFLLSNTLETSAEKSEDDDYRRYVISLIKKNPEISAILSDKKVAARAANVKKEFETFAQILRENTVMAGKVAFSDLRPCPNLPKGSNYVVYSLFPSAVTSVRIMPEKEDKEGVKISVGHNIFHEPKSQYDVGAALKRFGGGGHKSVGGASVKKEEAEAIAKKIIEEINNSP
jgi:oligoribonuclease NrnB/cAMP/cGMP phosphodiesterase (DHH superfamily)